MAARQITHASVIDRRVIQSDPAGQVCERRGARPVGIVLMPGDYTAVIRWFAEELIVPEPQRTAEQLRSGNEESRMPEQIMEAGFDAPGAEGVEDYAGRIC